MLRPLSLRAVCPLPLHSALIHCRNDQDLQLASSQEAAAELPAAKRRKANRTEPPTIHRQRCSKLSAETLVKIRDQVLDDYLNEGKTDLSLRVALSEGSLRHCKSKDALKSIVRGVTDAVGPFLPCDLAPETPIAGTQVPILHRDDSRPPEEEAPRRRDHC